MFFLAGVVTLLIGATAPAHCGLSYPRLYWAYWNGMAEFDDAVIVDPDWYCRGGFFVLVDGSICSW